MKIHWKVLDIVNPSRIRKLSGRKYAHHCGLLDGFTHCYCQNGVAGFCGKFSESVRDLVELVCGTGVCETRELSNLLLKVLVLRSRQHM